jgi:hypothetical protein
VLVTLIVPMFDVEPLVTETGDTDADSELFPGSSATTE